MVLGVLGGGVGMVLGVLGGGVGMGIRSTWWWCRYGY